MPKTKINKTPSSPNASGASSVDHNPELKGEAMSLCRFPKGLPEIFLDYLGGDIKPISEPNTKGESLSEQYKEFKLFGKKLSDIMHEEAVKVSNLILQGEEKEIEEALAIVRKKPFLLRCEVEAQDLLGRRVRGTPLQIAAMAGDLDLKPGITVEKDLGMVERLVAAGKLSQEEVKEQLKCVTSKEALKANEERNERVLVAIKKFGNNIAEVKADNNLNFEAFQLRCKPFIDQLEEDLRPNNQSVTAAGYIFDPTVLQKAAEWFQENLQKFGDLWGFNSDVFWVNGFGTLQANLSSRDAEIIRAGVYCLIFRGDMPLRLLDKSGSQLGRVHYIGYFGGHVGGLGRFVPGMRRGGECGIGRLMRHRHQAERAVLPLIFSN